jgi:hypothetical protein
MGLPELKKQASELVLRIEVYANLPKDNLSTEAYFAELRKDVQQFGEEIAAVPSDSDRYHLLDHIIRGLMDCGLIESVIKALVGIIS